MNPYNFYDSYKPAEQKEQAKRDDGSLPARNVGQSMPHYNNSGQPEMKGSASSLGGSWEAIDKADVIREMDSGQPRVAAGLGNPSYFDNKNALYSGASATTNNGPVRTATSAQPFVPSMASLGASHPSSKPTPVATGFGLGIGASSPSKPSVSAVPAFGATAISGAGTNQTGSSYSASAAPRYTAPTQEHHTSGAKPAYEPSWSQPKPGLEKPKELPKPFETSAAKAMPASTQPAELPTRPALPLASGKPAMSTSHGSQPSETHIASSKPSTAESSPKKKATPRKVATPTGTPRSSGRQRHAVERLTPTSETTPTHARPIEIPAGHGSRLADIPHVHGQLSKRNSADKTVQLVHRLVFHRVGEAAKRKANLRAFHGLAKEDLALLREKLSKHHVEELKDVCYFLNLERSGEKNVLAERIAEFMKQPKDLGESKPTPKRSRKSTPTKRKSSPKKSPKKKTAARKSESDGADRDSGKEDDAESEEIDVDEDDEAILDEISPKRSKGHMAKDDN